MSTIIAVPSKGCIIRISPTQSPIAYQTVAHQGTITGLNMSTKMEDVTQQDSGYPFRDFVPTLIDPGSASFTIFLQPATAGHKLLLTLFTNRGADATPGAPIPTEIVFSDVALTTWTFNSFIQDFKCDEPVDGVIKAQITFKATGQVTFPA